MAIPPAATAIHGIDATALEEALTTARAVLVGAILDQQFVDGATGHAPGCMVEPGRLAPPARERLRAARRPPRPLPRERAMRCRRSLGRVRLDRLGRRER